MYSAGEMIPVNLELVNELWLPNIFIYNLKTFKVGLMMMMVVTLVTILWAVGSSIFWT